MSEMQVMDPTGHTVVKWSPKNSTEVDAARETFNALRAKGYSAFRVDKETKNQGARLDTFDPKAKKMIMVPQLRGG